MRVLLLTVVPLLLLGCKNELRISPNTIASFEYGTYIGFAGWVIKLTVYPQRQVLQPDYWSAKTCETAIAADEWNELTKLFDENAFKKVKVGEESVCSDANSYWIIARSATGEIKAVWGTCTGGNPTGIQPLINALDKRMQATRANCK